MPIFQQKVEAKRLFIEKKMRNRSDAAKVGVETALSEEDGGDDDGSNHRGEIGSETARQGIARLANTY